MNLRRQLLEDKKADQETTRELHEHHFFYLVQLVETSWDHSESLSFYRVVYALSEHICGLWGR